MLGRVKRAKDVKLRQFAALGLLLASGGFAACRETPRELASSSTTRTVASVRGDAGADAPLEVVERITGGASADARLPMVVVIHGLGDRPEGIAGIVEGLSRPARLILPRGFDAYGDGYSWFPYRPEATELENGVVVARAAQRLAEGLARLQRERPTEGLPIVTGFSQGGILSFALAIRGTPIVRLALPIAGALPALLLPPKAPEGAPPVVALHGDADQRVPYARGRAAVEGLATRGFRAELITYPGVSHSVDAAMRRELLQRLEAALPQAR
jgi:phospholipase/carboxylesterase